ncbi:MAG: AAA family ATPase [Candidatus Pacebacteria bacterium]|nr:AAA family ATPase [Candidatus Paceibacterota bacterium]
MHIIGIAGTIGAGKGTVVDYLKERGFAHYSSSGLLKEILIEQGTPVDRDALAALARSLRVKDPNGVPKLTYERTLRDNPEKMILEAIHTLGEADFIRSVGGMMLGVDADVAIRYERISKRGSEKDNVSYEKFLEQAKREDDGTEESGHNIRGVIQTADAVVMNNGTLEELHRAIDSALEKIS